MEALLFVIENNSEYIKYYENAQTIVINLYYKDKGLLSQYTETQIWKCVDSEKHLCSDCKIILFTLDTLFDNLKVSFMGMKKIDKYVWNK